MSAPAPTTGSTNGDQHVRVGGRSKTDDGMKEDRQLQKLQASIKRSLPNMMFGYGDTNKPLHSTADVLSNLAIDFVGEMTKKVVALAAERGDGEITYQNLLFLIRGDSYQFDRAWELKSHNEEVRRAREIAHATDDSIQ